MTTPASLPSAQPNPFREPLVWLVVGLPMVAVIAACVTLAIAVMKGDSLVAADYYKQGLQVNQDTARQRVATELGLVARIDRLDGHTQMQLQAGPAAAERMADPALMPASITFVLTHPVDELLDRRIAFDRVSTDCPEHTACYRTQATLPDGRWTATLQTPLWRIDQPVQVEQSRLTLVAKP
jgi:hypothetical protein